MTQAFIRRRELSHPELGTKVFFEIVTLHAGGRQHVTSEGWETHSTWKAAAAEAKRRGFDLVDEP